jgi:hypothetical protein
LPQELSVEGNQPDAEVPSDRHEFAVVGGVSGLGGKLQNVEIGRLDPSFSARNLASAWCRIRDPGHS